MSLIKHLLPTLNKSHIVHQDIRPLIETLKQEPNLDVQLIGHSFENRDIHLLTLGSGPIVIFAWTQMHGNEATATAAVFDWIDGLLDANADANAANSTANNEATNTDIPQNWAQRYTIHILPMLNPDGAERCIRQNAQAIDINRDARELQSPEGALLMHMAKTLSPDIGFNLHDQSPYYQCGTTGNPATIAFLAPAFDVPKTIDTNRERAIKLIAHMNHCLQDDIPNAVARYDDTYSPRSFGDNIAGLGVSTILIESGAAKGDPDRQIARRLNLKALNTALDYLQSDNLPANNNAFEHATIDSYFAIPENISEALSSLVIRNLSFAAHTSPFKTGVSIKQTARYSNKFVVDFIGDLHIQAGLAEFDANGLFYKPGKVFDVTENLSLNKESYLALIAQGYLYFNDPDGLLINESGLSVAYRDHQISQSEVFTLQQEAYCLFAKEDQIVGAMINSELVFLH